MVEPSDGYLRIISCDRVVDHCEVRLGGHAFDATPSPVFHSFDFVDLRRVHGMHSVYMYPLYRAKVETMPGAPLCMP